MLPEALAIAIIATLAIILHASATGRPVRFALQDWNAWFVAVLASAFMVTVWEMLTGPLQ